jgi:transglutaminase-like putative cysteine protease
MKRTRGWLAALLMAAAVSLGPVPWWVHAPIAAALVWGLTRLPALPPRATVILAAAVAIQGAGGLAAGWGAAWAAASLAELAMVGMAGMRRAPPVGRTLVWLSAAGLFAVAAGPLESGWMLPALVAALPPALGSFLAAAEAPAPRAALALGSLAAALAVPLFLLHPKPFEALQSAGRSWAGPAAAPAPPPERTFGNVALSAAAYGRRSGDATPLMVVVVRSGLEQLRDEAGRPALYLRERVADTYRSGVWTAERPPGELRYPPAGRLVLSGEEATVEGEVLRVEPRYVPDFYHVAGAPVWVEGAASYRLDPVHQELRVPEGGEGPRRYAFGSRWRSEPPEREAAHPDPAHRELYLLESELGPIVQGWTRPEQTPWQRARAIRERLRAECRYGRPAPAGTADRTLHFLSRGRTGECGEFASAATLLLRAADVPARMAVGYLSTELHREGDAAYFVVRARDAHAWTEIRLRERGWVVVDVTPPAPSGRTQVFPLGAARQRAAPPAPAPAAPAAWDEPVRRYRGDGAAGPWAAIALLAALLAATLVSLAARRRQERAAGRRPLPGRAEAHALPFFSEFLKILRSSGLTPRPGETIGRFAARLPARVPAGPVAALVALYEAARFGGRPLGEPERRRAREALAELRRAP